MSPSLPMCPLSRSAGKTRRCDSHDARKAPSFIPSRISDVGIGHLFGAMLATDGKAR
eukprot:CAMPEP_0204131268 /NCGR_PEP_ID=MMETSP0361-20130328/13843_1 /ASSEMBLY_ACC=CAM_ASM_000343 /TAXON_ID=268821 /ORGANISM="Scrippsiella Hangoei, Strain SHTV-5" /LENGTH=56 /DNA_ID=CAMNT_0051083983 /DNA_START=90 /DNA_END=256 /DNA_ORIENTATION=+